MSHYLIQSSWKVWQNMLFMRGSAEAKRLNGHLGIPPSSCKLYTKKIAPHQDIKRDNRLFSQLLFGKGYQPKMLGYAVGFNIVKKYLTANKANTADGLSIPAETFLNATL